MKNKNITKLVISFLIILVISLISSFIINNYNVLLLSKQQQTENKINLSILNYTGFNYENNSLVSTSDDNKSISLNYTGYINKLIITYKTLINSEINITYNGENYYNKQTEKTLIEGLNNKLGKSVIVINEETNSIKLNFDNESSVKIESIIIDNTLSFNTYLFIYILLGLSLITIILFYFKFDLFKGKIEYLFLTSVLLIGTLFIILQPKTTSYSWDDQVHYSENYRLYELDGTTEWTEASKTMTEINPFININTEEEMKLVDEYLDNADEIVMEEANSPLIQYNQAGYLISGLTMKLSSILNLPFTLGIVITKFAMLITYALIMFYAIKIIPRGKRILSVVGLFPSLVFLSTQFSYDPPLIAGIALFIALFIDIIENNRKVDLKTSVILLLSIIIPCFIKAVYIPLILLLLFIPKDRFKVNKTKKIFKSGIIIIFILMMSTFILPTVTSTSSLGDLRGGNTSTSGQLQTIMNNPLGYINVLEDTALKEFSNKLIGQPTVISYSYVDSMKETSNTNLYYLILIILIFVISTDSYYKNSEKQKYIKIFNIILNLGIIVLIWTAMYLAFTPVGELTINGVQNRYFIPLLFPLILITLSNNKIKCNIDNKKYDSIIILLISIILLYSVYTSFLTCFCM